MIDKQTLTKIIDKANLASTYTKCPKRWVGAVVTNQYYDILAIEHNQTVNNNFCNCNSYSEFKGSRNNNCLAIHAEVAAIITACYNGNGSYWWKPFAILTTCSPCINCAKIIAFSGIKEVYYIEDYCDESIRYLKDQGINCEKVEKILHI